ncbi:alpha-amylase family glycosyl hydrolase [Thalassotalea fonticola]|uniref:Alpha-amylase family glycosyl hydrolase n=1 Tax=Thalassotalea fonticola TaxID=3065649 RepID=A0ABZ0GKD3_9GAMM|nr:alpha-amylase family glycosyl hydrolase [Colwelliaceae bacterium S1-1]
MNRLKIVILGFFALALSACDSVKPDSEQVETQIKTAKISAELPHYLTRDIRDEVFYFVMPDRFHNGDTSNDNGSVTILESQGGFDPSSNGHYHGGDIIGLKEKLPYLQEMGITSIWMTPIMRNQAVQGDSSGYHGYWVLDFTEIDPHLGSNQDLKNLIDAAHALNMKVFFDIIANHSADVIKYKECHGENGDQQLGETKGLCDYKTLEQIANGDTYSAFVLPGSEDIKVPQWLNDPKYYNNQGDSTWEGESSVYGDFAGLDDIDTANPEVISGLIEVFKNVVSEFKPDGFRIDTVKHVNMEFWSEFSPAIVEHAKSIGIEQFFMFGEVYDFTPEFLSTFTTTGKMQSILDFAVQGAISKTLVEHKGTNELENIFNGDHYYQDEDSDASMLVTFTGNHDMGRFAHLLDKENPEMSEPEKLARVKLSNALMYFSRGIPVVYYGDEQGFVGDGNDKNSRQDMMPSKVDIYNDDDLIGTDATTADANFDQSHVLYQDLVNLASLYLEHDALRHGKQEQVYSQQTPGLYAFTRTFKNEQYLVVANTATTEQKQTMTLSYNDFKPVVLAKDKSENNGVVTMNLAPLTYAIYKAKK